MSPLERFMSAHPAMFAALVTIPIALLVAYLTGEFSPIEAVRSVKGF